MEGAVVRQVRIFSEKYMETAIQAALLEEVSTTPKPGLVDRHDSGAHKDMNYQTFVKSTYAIAPYILQMSKQGFYWKDDLKRVFPMIRKIGMEAEQAMYRATEGVNTHKGLIFSMGIIACVAGWYYGKHQRFDTDKILKLAGSMTKETLQKDFERIERKNPATYGEDLYIRYHDRGIRGEVMDGFPTIRRITMPVIRAANVSRQNQNERNIDILLKLMANVNDTNVLHRGNIEKLKEVQREAIQILNMGGASTDRGMEAVKEMNNRMIQSNLSPGGCADLLAVTIFVWLLEQYN